MYNRWNQIIPGGKQTNMDAAALLDHTLLHELTHAVKKEPTTDARGPKDSYGWTNCVSKMLFNGANIGYTNADSYAFFAVGADMILNGKDGTKILVPQKDGSVIQTAAAAAKRFAALVMRAISFEA